MIHEPHEAGCPLAAEIGLAFDEGSEGLRVERRRVAKLERSHHLIAAQRVGHRVNSHRRHPSETRQDPFDRRRGEVLTVHPQPVRASAREPKEALVVAVREVAAPVPTVA